jgi:hypothetical protein
MAIRLGNLSVTDIETRLGIEFPEDIRDFMKSTRQENASNIKEGKWHCFDIPFLLVCGDISVAQKIYDSVKHRSSECKEVMQIGLEK